MTSRATGATGARLRRSAGLVAIVAMLAAWSVAEAQPARPHRVGVLTPAAAQWREATFRERLRELGYVEGVTLVLDVRSGEARLDRMAALGRDLVGERPDVIVAVNTPGTRAALDATKTIPIVMAMVGDPIGLGFVTSLARPTGNVTGISNMMGELASKRLALLREAVPGATRVALLYHPDEPIVAPQVRDLEAVGPRLGVRFRRLAVRTADDLARAVDAAVEWRADALLRLAGQATTLGVQTAQLALERRLPSMLVTAREVEAGALMSYYADDAAAYRRVADYVHRILQGSAPRDLPVERPTRYELVVNGRTARALGLVLPPSLLTQADRVID